MTRLDALGSIERYRYRRPSVWYRRTARDDERTTAAASRVRIVVGKADNEIAAAMARLEHATGEQRAQLQSFVQMLRQQLGMGAVHLSRRGLWGLGRLESAQFVIGDHSYRVALRGGKIVTEIADAVGGVGLSHYAVPPAQWAQQLTHEIDAAIEENP